MRSSLCHGCCFPWRLSLASFLFPLGISDGKTSTVPCRRLDRYGHVPPGRIVFLLAADRTGKRLECLGRTCYCSSGGHDANFGFIYSFLLPLAFDFRTIAIKTPRGNHRCCISSVGSPFIGPGCLWSRNLRMVVDCIHRGIFHRYGIGIPEDPFYRSFGDRRTASFVA